MVCRRRLGPGSVPRYADARARGHRDRSPRRRVPRGAQPLSRIRLRRGQQRPDLGERHTGRTGRHTPDLTARAGHRQLAARCDFDAMLRTCLQLSARHWPSSSPASTRNVAGSGACHPPDGWSAICRLVCDDTSPFREQCRAQQAAKPITYGMAVADTKAAIPRVQLVISIIHRGNEILLVPESLGTDGEVLWSPTSRRRSRGRRAPARSSPTRGGRWSNRC